jgi:hypothetical protein
MSISPISSSPALILTPTTAVQAQGGILQTQIADFGIVDEIKLSRQAITLLLGGGAAPPAK